MARTIETEEASAGGPGQGQSSPPLSNLPSPKTPPTPTSPLPTMTASASSPVISPSSGCGNNNTSSILTPSTSSSSNELSFQSPLAKAASADRLIPPSMLSTKGVLKPVALSFSGCGFLGTYHMGSVKCFMRHGTAVLSRTHRFAGASAGSLVAALVALAPHKIDVILIPQPEALVNLYDLADEVNSLSLGALTPDFSLIRKLEELAHNILPKESCPEQANQKLYVSTTNLKTKANALTCQYKDRDFLIKEYADGGLSDNMPKFPDLDTITVSPFSGEADISPNDGKGLIFDWDMRLGNQTMKANLKNLVRGAQALWPPKREVLQEYHDLGFRDTMNFLLENDYFERPEGTPV